IGIGRPDGSAETVVGIVGDSDGLTVIRVRNHREHGAKDFLAGNAGAVVEVGEQCRPHEPAVVEALRATGATDDDACAIGSSSLDVSVDPRALGAAGHRTDQCVFVEADANGSAAHDASESVDNFGVAASRREDSGSEEADLAVVGQSRSEERLPNPSEVQIRVVEDDGCGLASELEGDRSQETSARLGDGPAARSGTREGDLVYPGVGDQVGTELTPTRNHA